MELEFEEFAGVEGSASVAPFQSDDSGVFWFFEADNWEALVKVLDGCAQNGHFWVFAAATTNVEATLRVTDTQSGLVKEYFNLLGNAAQAVTDVNAIASCQ